uniref:Variant surface glycoprotein n=1 Tax=Trypanosoma brucei TaxID=5691 RepID=A0A1V0FYM4_9TRYP|nr:variant surface glycoprotein [Trypanosoma brucei]
MEANKQRLLEMKAELTLLNVTAGTISLWGSRQLSVTSTNKVEPAAQCNNHKTNKTCTAAKCKLEEKDGKGECKPKDGAEQKKAAGTGGDGASGTAASTECAKHGTKTECDADKKDDKQNCAFRKGKDNEDDKVTEKRRSSSFLIKKKIAMIAAAFCECGITLTIFAHYYEIF